MFPCHRASKSCESDSARKRDTEHGEVEYSGEGSGGVWTVMGCATLNRITSHHIPDTLPRVSLSESQPQ